MDLSLECVKLNASNLASRLMLVITSLHMTEDTKGRISRVA